MMGDTAATPAPQNANKRKQMEDAGKTQLDMQHVGLWLYKTCSLAGWHASIYSMPTNNGHPVNGLTCSLSVHNAHWLA